MSGSENNIIREQSLRYPKLSLGLKNPKKDPELRGKADYILEVKGRIRWVLESKAPQIQIDNESIEQTWTYASHPEVRAVYFVICNGLTLSIFLTSHGPSAGALLTLPFEEFENKFQLLSNLLSPEALLHEFDSTKIDVGLPIAIGLRSLARISNGVIQLKRNSLNLRSVNDLQMYVEDGDVQRDQDGKLVASLRTIVHSQSLQELNERLGLSNFEMNSDSTELSTDQQNPTIFSYSGRAILPAGEEVPDVFTGRTNKFETNITCDVTAAARGVFADRLFRGAFEMSTRYREIGLDLTLSGIFKIHLA
jgi:hypothetical protein